jgi:heavy metal sensor kinase
MLESLRGRLLVWYTAMLAVVMAVFGVMVCYLALRARIANIDNLLHARAQELARALAPAAGGTFDLVLPPEPADSPAGAVYHVLWTATGKIIDRSALDIEVPAPRQTGARLRDGSREVTVAGPSGSFVLAGVSLAATYADIGALAATMAGVGVVALALALASGWWLVGRALQPIHRISGTAQAMVNGDFAARIPAANVATELGTVVQALNDAFDRLHESLERQRRFTADASHELRTPLATMSTELQWALNRERPAGEYRRALETCRRAADRMQASVERMLALAQAEGAPGPPRRVPLKLEDLVTSIVHDLQPLARARSSEVRVDGAPIVIVGDPDRLRDAITNILANAIQYNVAGGTVDVGLKQNGSWVDLSVADTGIGISATDLPRVFEPFFRADPARSREVGGAGLGLAISREIIRTHGGDITCESRAGTGTTMTIRLPSTAFPS